MKWTPVQLPMRQLTTKIKKSNCTCFYQISVPEVGRIDTGAIYNKMTIRELQENISALDWVTYFTQLVYPMNITLDEEVVSYSTLFFMRLGEVLENTDKRYGW